jgi:hypothetical protein
MPKGGHSTGGSSAGKKGCKIGRWRRKPSNLGYQYRRPGNLMRRLASHMRHHPKDLTAVGALARWKANGVPGKHGGAASVKGGK